MMNNNPLRRLREEIKEKIKDSLDTFFIQICEDWEQIGVKQSVEEANLNVVHNHFQELMNDMLNETKDNKRVLVESIEKLMQSVQVLSQELGTKMPQDGYEAMPLREIEANLQEQLRNLETIKERRLKYLEELLEREHDICKSLGAQRIGIASSLPTDEELLNFKLYLEKQEAEKNRLEKAFEEMRQAIVKMMTELQITPCLDFERLVCNDHENFVFTSSNMTKARELRNQLMEQVEEAKFEAERKREELLELWKYLGEPEHRQQAFFENHPGYSVTTLNAMNAEVKRCKQKRSENIANYVKQIRVVLTNLWDACRYGEDERAKFVHFDSKTYTEDLLTLHELEVERLRAFYEENRSIFELLDERDATWEKMKALEQRANDPQRFYNRGGQLLAEEKERKLIQKKIPKIEEQLHSLMNNYQAAHGTPFTVRGQPLAEYLKHTWEEYDVEKQSEKNARKQAKDQSAKKILLSASKRGVGISSVRQRTPVGSAKRKQPCEPSPSSQSMKRRNVSSESRATTSSAKVRKGFKASRRIFAVRSSPRTSARKKAASDSQNSSSNGTSYLNFQEHLEEREELRSSALPEQVLRDVNKSRAKTPVRTPVKTPAKSSRKKVGSTPNTTPKTLRSRGTPRSPRMATTPRLVAAPGKIPFIF